MLWAFGVEPETGTVYYVLPDGEAWFANTSIELWLRTLYHHSQFVKASSILNDSDGPEDEALAALRVLEDELRDIDPPALDPHSDRFWAEFLGRWLW